VDTRKTLDKLRFTPKVEIALFRIAQEATRNAVQHGHAKHATVRLRRQDESLSLIVIDDGQGFDLQEVDERGMGLRMMRQRALSLAGTMNAESRPGRTTISVSVPARPLSTSSGSKSRRTDHKRSESKRPGWGG